MLVTALFLCELERASSISGDKGWSCLCWFWVGFACPRAGFWIRTRIEEWSLKGDWEGKEKIQITLLLCNRFALLKKEDCWYWLWKWDSSCIVCSWVMEIWGEGGSLQVWPGRNPPFRMFAPPSFVLCCICPGILRESCCCGCSEMSVLRACVTPEPLVSLESLWWVQDLGPVSCQVEWAKEERYASVLSWGVCVAACTAA